MQDLRGTSAPSPLRQTCYINLEAEPFDSQMLLFILLQLFFSGLDTIQALPAPLPAISFTATRHSTAESPGDKIQFDKNYRSTPEIIWACLSVIFACTWTAVHPNVYGYRSTFWQRTRRRALLFVLALLVPEVNLVWSVKQWLGAREITKRMRPSVPQGKPSRV